MSDLEKQLTDMKLDKLVTATRDYMLTHKTVPDAYVNALLERITRLRARNHVLAERNRRLSTPAKGSSADRLRKDINASAQSIRAICDHISNVTQNIR